MMENSVKSDIGVHDTIQQEFLYGHGDGGLYVMVVVIDIRGLSGVRLMAAKAKRLASCWLGVDCFFSCGRAVMALGKFRSHNGGFR